MSLKCKTVDDVQMKMHRNLIMLPLRRTKSFLRSVAVLVSCFALLASSALSQSIEKKPKPSDELFRDGFIPKIRIAIPPAGIATLRKYQWQWGGTNEDRLAVLGTVTDEGKTYTNVTIHLKGAAGSFRPVDQNPGLTLNFDKEAPGQKFHGLQKLSLNNSIQDPSLCSDKFSREIYRRVGVPVPRTGHARVFLNGRDLGLYVLAEGWNKQFLRQYFKNVDGNLYDCGFAKEINPNMHVNSGENPTNHSDLIALAAATEKVSSSKKLDALKPLLDIDRFLRLAVLDALLWNWDGYTIGHNNYRVFHDAERDKMVFMPHGLDQMFWRPDAPIMPGGKGTVGRAVLGTREGRDRYMELAREFMNTFFDSDTLTDRIREISASIQPVLADLGPAAQARQKRGADQLSMLIKLRLGSLRMQLNGSSNVVRLDSGKSISVTNWDADLAADQNIHLKATPGNLAMAKSVVWLEAGFYRVEGRVKTSGLKVHGGDEQFGAGFRVVSERKPSTGVSWDWFPFRESRDYIKRAELLAANSRDQRITTDSDWRKLTYDIELRQPMADVQILCELRADKGEAWFDTSSIRLTHVASPKKAAPKTQQTAGKTIAP